MKSLVSDDKLAIDVLIDMQWDVQLIPWRQPNVDWNAFDVVVIRSTWDYHNDPDMFIEVLQQIEASGTRLENALASVKWNIDKRYLHDLEGKGIRVVQTAFGSDLNESSLNELTQAYSNEDFIIKPVISASAKNTFRITPGKAPLENLLAAFKNKDYMVQPFMHHIVEEGEFSLFFFNGRYSHCIRKVPKSNDFRVQEEHGGLITTCPPTLKLLNCAQHVLDNLDYTVLYARVDLVPDENGDYALMELELIEPSLYLRMDPEAPTRFARAIEAIPL
ncbi:MAG: hypothetical protein KTR29_05090 [Rhodothermaceae bacterium]|nr:hypothetical protein [Rhodothermaceae bacterium]